MEFKNEAIKAIVQTATAYHETKNKNEAKRATYGQEYIGTKLMEKHQELDLSTAAAKSTMIETLKAAQDFFMGMALKRKDSYQNFTDGNALSGDNIPSDIRLLEIPALLTANELQILVNRHRDNVLFCRAVEAYVNKHKIVGVEFKPQHEKAIIEIRRTFELLNQVVDSDAMLDNLHWFIPADEGLTEAMAMLSGEEVA